MSRREAMGTVTVATPAATPTVTLDGDTVGYPTRNGLPGYTPALNDRVFVLVVDHRRVRISGLKR